MILNDKENSGWYSANDLQTKISSGETQEFSNEMTGPYNIWSRPVNYNIVNSSIYPDTRNYVNDFSIPYEGVSIVSAPVKQETLDEAPFDPTTASHDCMNMTCQEDGQYIPGTWLGRNDFLNTPESRYEKEVLDFQWSCPPPVNMPVQSSWNENQLLETHLRLESTGMENNLTNYLDTSKTCPIYNVRQSLNSCQFGESDSSKKENNVSKYDTEFLQDCENFCATNRQENSVDCHNNTEHQETPLTKNMIYFEHSPGAYNNMNVERHKEGVTNQLHSVNLSYDSNEENAELKSSTTFCENDQDFFTNKLLDTRKRKCQGNPIRDTLSNLGQQVKNDVDSTHDDFSKASLNQSFQRYSCSEIRRTNNIMSPIYNQYDKESHIALDTSNDNVTMMNPSSCSSVSVGPQHCTDSGYKWYNDIFQSEFPLSCSDNATQDKDLSVTKKASYDFVNEDETVKHLQYMTTSTSDNLQSIFLKNNATQLQTTLTKSTCSDNNGLERNNYSYNPSTSCSEDGAPSEFWKTNSLLQAGESSGSGCLNINCASSTIPCLSDSTSYGYLDKNIWKLEALNIPECIDKAKSYELSSPNFSTKQFEQFGNQDAYNSVVNKSENYLFRSTMPPLSNIQQETVNSLTEYENKINTFPQLHDYNRLLSKKNSSHKEFFHTIVQAPINQKKKDNIESGVDQTSKGPLGFYKKNQTNTTTVPPTDSCNFNVSKVGSYCDASCDMVDLSQNNIDLMKCYQGTAALICVCCILVSLHWILWVTQQWYVWKWKHNCTDGCNSNTLLSKTKVNSGSSRKISSKPIHCNEEKKVAMPKKLSEDVLENHHNTIFKDYRVLLLYYWVDVIHCWLTNLGNQHGFHETDVDPLNSIKSFTLFQPFFIHLKNSITNHLPQFSDILVDLICQDNVWLMENIFLLQETTDHSVYNVHKTALIDCNSLNKSIYPDVSIIHVNSILQTTICYMMNQVNYFCFWIKTNVSESCDTTKNLSDFFFQDSKVKEGFLIHGMHDFHKEDHRSKQVVPMGSKWNDFYDKATVFQVNYSTEKKKKQGCATDVDGVYNMSNDNVVYEGKYPELNEKFDIDKNWSGEKGKVILMDNRFEPTNKAFNEGSNRKSVYSPKQKTFQTDLNVSTDNKPLSFNVCYNSPSFFDHGDTTRNYKRNAIPRTDALSPSYSLCEHDFKAAGQLQKKIVMNKINTKTSTDSSLNYNNLLYTSTVDQTVNKTGMYNSSDKVQMKEKSSSKKKKTVSSNYQFKNSPSQVSCDTSAVLKLSDQFDKRYCAPGLYFDRRRRGFRIRFQNIYVGWVSLSRYASYEQAYSTAKMIWDNAVREATTHQNRQAALHAGIPLQIQTRLHVRNPGGRPRTVSRLSPLIDAEILVAVNTAKRSKTDY